MTGQPIQSYRNLRVWQDSMTLAEECYKLTRAFPKDELYGMTSQIRRASTSVAANIAEGHGRESTQSFIQFLRVAQGSLKELETHLLLSERVGVATSPSINLLTDRCSALGKMLRNLIRTLQTKNKT